MKKIILFLFLLLIPIDVEASSASFAVMDSDSGRILAGSNINESMLIASTTKIMTAIIALENSKLTDKYKVGEEIDKVYGSAIYVKKDEILTLEDLLYGLLLRSGNDAAMVIASNVTDYDNFIKLMNKKAASLEMHNTVFTNPHGLDDDTKNYSTAKDLAILMKYAMENGQFAKITSTKKYKCETNLNIHIWYNKNDLLTEYKFATGGKIGYTKKSGHIFVSSATKEDKNLIVVTFKDTDRFNNHETLYEKYFNMYEKYQILNRYTFIVDEKQYKKYHLYIKNDFYMLLKNSEIKNLKLDIHLAKNKIIFGETKIGYVNVMLGENIIHSENIYGIVDKSKINKIKSLLYFWKK